MRNYVYVLNKAFKGATNNINNIQNLFASSSSDTTVNIWNLTSGSLIFTLKGHVKSVYSLAYLNTLNYLASVSSDSTRIRNVSTGTLILTYNTSASYYEDVSSNLLELEQGLLASGSYNGDLNIWDIKRGTLKNKIKTSKWNLSVNAIVKLKNNLLASGGGGSYFISGIGTKFEGTLNIWNISSFTLYCSFGSLLNQSHTNRVFRLASLDNGLLASYSWDDNIKIWNVTNKKLLHTFTKINEIGAPDVTGDLVYLGNSFLAVGSYRYFKMYYVLLGKLVFKVVEALIGDNNYRIKII